MFKPALPYVVFYAQKWTNTACVVQPEESATEHTEAYVGVNGRNYLDALKKRMCPMGKNTQKPQIPVTSNDIPVFTYEYFNFKTKIFSKKNDLKSPDYFKHFVISEYSFSIFHPPKIAGSFF